MHEDLFEIHQYEDGWVMLVHGHEEDVVLEYCSLLGKWVVWEFEPGDLLPSMAKSCTGPLLFDEAVDAFVVSAWTLDADEPVFMQDHPCYRNPFKEGR